MKRLGFAIVAVTIVLAATSCQHLIPTPTPAPIPTVIPSPTPAVMISALKPIRLISLTRPCDAKVDFALHVDFLYFPLSQGVVNADDILEVELKGIYLLTYKEPLKQRIKYEFDVITCIAGDYDRQTFEYTISYNTPYTLNIGSRYIFLLQRIDNVFHSKTDYQIDAFNVLEVRGGKVYSLDHTCLFNNKRAYETYVKERLADPEATPNLPLVITQCHAIYPQAIADYSDAIVEVTVKSKEVGCSTHQRTSCVVNRSYKGKLVQGTTFSLHLFSSVMEGENYLLLLQRDKYGNYTPASKYGCVNLNETERYQQYMDCLTEAGLIQEDKE